MSETDKDREAADPTEKTDAGDAVPAADADANGGATEPDATPDSADPEPVTAATAEKKSVGAGSIAWLALFLALAAAAGSGYLFLEKFRGEQDTAEVSAAVDTLTDRVGDAADRLEALGDRVDGLGATAGQVGDDVDSLERRFDDRAQLLDSLPQRMTSLERSVASLQGVSIDARNTYLVAEAEYYMQIANAQLQLANNPTLAALALEQADDRLLELGDPALTDVRRTLANEIAALAVVEKSDIAGVALTLASLSRVVESLPLRSAVEAEAEAEAAAAAQEDGGLARAWGAVKGAFSGLVEYTPPDAGEAPLLAPDAEPLIRSNLALQLQAARLALLRGEQQIFEQSLDDARAWIESYFAVATEPVKGALETLAEIREGYSTMTKPDISESLRLLRQYKALAESRE